VAGSPFDEGNGQPQNARMAARESADSRRHDKTYLDTAVSSVVAGLSSVAREVLLAVMSFRLRLRDKKSNGMA